MHHAPVYRYEKYRSTQPKVMRKTLPMGDPGDPQHYDCHDRTSGLYPAYLASALCVVLAPLYAALDPEHGAKWLRGKPADDKLKEKHEVAEARMRARVGLHRTATM